MFIDHDCDDISLSIYSGQHCQSTKSRLQELHAYSLPISCTIQYYHVQYAFHFQQTVYISSASTIQFACMELTFFA